MYEYRTVEILSSLSREKKLQLAVSHIIGRSARDLISRKFLNILGSKALFASAQEEPTRHSSRQMKVKQPTLKNGRSSEASKFHSLTWDPICIPGNPRTSRHLRISSIAKDGDCSGTVPKPTNLVGYFRTTPAI